MDLTEISKCTNCNEGTVYNKSLRVVNSKCYKCDADMKVALIFIGYMYHGPENFSPSEILIAEKAGVILKESYSQTMEKSYLANICPSCGAFSGQFYLREHKQDADLGHSTFEDYSTGTTACDCCTELETESDEKNDDSL